jgi:hypothetical protein
MQAENNSATTLLRFQTDIRNFHAILTALGHCFEGAVELRGTSEVGLALLFILVGDGEVVLLDEGPVHYC